MSDARRVATLAALALVVATVAVGTGAAGAADPLRQEVTVSHDGGEVRAVARYEVPSSVTDLTVTFPVLERGNAVVVGADGFERVDTARFEWTGAAEPRVELALAADARRVMTGDGWAMVVRPDATVSYRYRGSEPEFTTAYAVAGEGYAASPFAYLGPHETSTTIAGGERTTFVVAAAAGDPDLDPAREFLRVAPGRFDFGVRRDRTTAFVLPAHEGAGGPHLAGATAETSFWVGADAVRLSSTDTAFTHEYVHTRLGAVGTTASARWLTEATAQYFGHAFALNAGAGSYGSFRGALRSEKYAPDETAVTLSRPESWEGTLADYRKGAHVLAALDAEIRERTDGRLTLADVFAARPGPYESHAAFRRAVVEVTGAPGLAEWIDRYVASDALPPLPDDPASYVYGADLDPDGDGVRSGAERAAGTNPFVATSTPATTATPTATATPTPTATPTATPPASTATPTAATRRPTTGTGDGFGPPSVAVAALAAFAVATRRR
ncbi:MAG: hypothetical protein ABEJ61_06430 [Haloferacaceae archaeon]